MRKKKQVRKKPDSPPALWPFEFHGVDFGDTAYASQAVGDCPFCDKRGHFYVNPETGQWDCKVCGKRGNVITFLTLLVDHWKDVATDADWRALSSDRGIPAVTLKRWGVVQRPDGIWALPSRNEKGNVVDLRVWRPGGRVFSTKGRQTPFLGSAQLKDPKRAAEPVYVCEGDWDVYAWDWALRKAGLPGVAVGVPGANVFKEAWSQLLVGRDVAWLYDNDDAGDDGSKRASAMVGASAKSQKFVHWPDTRPPGYDLRDYVTEFREADEPAKAAVKTFLKLLKPTHRRAVTATGADKEVSSQKKVRVGPPPTFEQTVDRFRKWLKMTDDLTDALMVCLATVMSNRIPGGDLVWVYVVGPSGGGKTAILTSFDGVEDCVFRSTLKAKALVSGWKDAVDPSLIPKLNGKVLVMKDYTQVLNANMQEQEDILSILRGAYDGVTEQDYGNGIYRKYHSRFSIISGVTSAIHGKSMVTLGERFLKFQIVRDSKLAEEIGRAVHKTLFRDVEMGDELKQAVADFLDRPVPDVDHLPKITDEYVDRVNALCELVGMLRAKVERDARDSAVKYRTQEEYPTRLMKQLLRLAVGLALVMGKKEVDEDVHRLVERVAFDTAIGFHLDFVEALVNIGESASIELVGREANLPYTNTVRARDDLLFLGIIRQSDPQKNRNGTGRKFVYSLAKRVKHLWDKARIVGRHGDREAYARRHREGSRKEK